MKTIKMQKWEIKAFNANEKACIRLPMNPQPQKDRDGMWYWKDCQWMDGGLGFPQSGVEDYAPFSPGDIVCIGGTQLYFRVKTVRVEQLQDITNDSAEREGCKAVFLTEDLHIGIFEEKPFEFNHKIPARENYAHLWDYSSERQGSPMDAFIGRQSTKTNTWDENPWVWIVEFIKLEKAELPEAGECKYCNGKTRLAFRCDVRTLKKNGTITDIAVPVVRCPYCGRILD